ncbi:MAG: magnesium-translocating P-type ATPase [Planctomycetia bacterium]|nr:magnesium-translocating P-type ATPase [Planctomycetia bacterium]
MTERPKPFWSVPCDALIAQLGSRSSGLTSAEAESRQGTVRREIPHHRASDFALALNQFKSPIVLILIFSTALSFALGDRADATIILIIIVASAGLSFWQERTAADAVSRLLATITTKATVLRGGHEQEIPAHDVMPGDVAVLAAGDAIPGDARILESQDLFVDEAALTGETYPVEKQAGTLPADTALAARANALFLGTHVVSGRAKALVVGVGATTEFGHISERLARRAPETDFERGVRRFGYFLLEVTLLLVIAIFAVNVYLERPVLQAFLFSLALAVGLTPQLLPAIISVNLAHGARRMAKSKVIVRRLASIENFGSMNVLCSDKTGTLTEGTIKLKAALDVAGQPSKKVLEYAYLNASFESGFANPIDTAIRASGACDMAAWRKLDEIPYDFLRKRLSILAESPQARLLVTKGAVPNVLAVCTRAETADGQIVELASVRRKIEEIFADFGRQGFRSLAVACRSAQGVDRVGKEAETDMTFQGLLILEDPLKPQIGDAVTALDRLGVRLKMVTGDNRLVAATIARQVGLDGAGLVTGGEMRDMSDAALRRRAGEAHVFAEIEPNQKERLITALRGAGYVVGYIGDGINDASALHAADVGISVDTAVDVAKETADIVLLEHDLHVLAHGVREGRKTFANTLKYVFMATSANFGNMLSMALSSMFLPFLPLLPKQILLTNLLTDLPEMMIATDSVDPEAVDQPRRWDVAFIRRFMLAFGTISSVFDIITFAVLVWLLKASEVGFRTGWFLESVVSASLIVLVVRSRRPFFRSRPSPQLVAATLVVIVATIALPWTPAARLFDLGPLPLKYLGVLAAIVAAYVVTAEAAKVVFYRGPRP